jgi:Mce-associated membrane protein
MAARWTPRLTRPSRRLVDAVLVAGCAVLLALCGWFGYALHQDELADERRQEILAAARQLTVNFTSLDHQTYERDSENVLRYATGEFKEQFAAHTTELTSLVAENESVSAGQVLEAGIVREDADSARVLVVADSEVSNVAVPEGEVRHYRLQLDLVLENGRWLTSRVEFVG